MKFLKRLGLILLGVLLLAWFGIDYFLQNKIDDLLRSRISAQLGDDYDFQFEGSKLNLLNNDFRIKEVEIQRGFDNSIRWKFKVAELRLNGFAALPFISKGILAADSITISKPHVDIYELNIKPKGARLNSNQPAAPDLKFAIKKIKISDASLLLDPEGPELLRSGMDVNIEGVNFQGNILSMLDSLSLLEVNLPEIQYVTPDSVYTVMAKSLNISHTLGVVGIDSLSMKNNIGLTQFSRFMHWRKSLFDIEIPRIDMSLPTAYQDTGWRATHLTLRDPLIKIMKDLRFPLPDRRTELPQEQLLALGLNIWIDSISLENADVELLNRVSGASTSELVIGKINGYILNLQNFDINQPAYTLVADGKLMHKADVHTKVTYIYGDLNPFELSGRVNDVNLETLDLFLRRQLGVSIASGTLDGIVYDMKGNHNGIRGEVEFRYHDLKVHLVDKDTDKDKVILNILSDSAGNLVFYRNNPQKDQLRIGKFYVERDVRKGFISQWVDGMLQGVANSITKREVNIQEAGEKQKKKGK